MNMAFMVFEEGTVRRKVLFLGEGTPDEIFISFEGDDPYEIYLQDRNRWRTQDGIKIGTSIEALNRINGKPVSFAGFEWDNSGYVILGDGSINKDHYAFALSPNYDVVPQDAVTEFLGSDVYDSSSPNVEKLQLYVDRIVYRF